jgi:tripartite-type tricarboxylate transporter receptor subunit TctC
MSAIGKSNGACSGAPCFGFPKAREEDRMKRKYSLRIVLVAFLAPLFFLPHIGFSQAPFYQGKTLRIINNDPGGTAGLRTRTVANYLRKHLPGNPTVIVEFIEGGGGRRAANYMFHNAKPDGLTVGALSSSAIGLNVMRETGVMYDIDKFIYLGTPVSENHNVFYTRAQLGLNSLEKLRAASGLRLGAQEVGAVAYISSRLFAYFLDLKAPRYVTGYTSLQADVALVNAEIDSRANNTSSVLRRNSDWVEKGIMDFHAILAVPKGEKHPHPRFAKLPEIEEFAKAEKEKKLLAMWRGFRTAASPFVLPPGTPKERVEPLQDAMRKVFKDPEFQTEFKKLVTDDPSPLTAEELVKVIREMPRDQEVIDLLKVFSGVEPLPSR